MKAALDEQREALLKLFSAEDGRNPLFDFKDAMVKVYKELGDAAAGRGRGEPQADRGADRSRSSSCKERGGRPAGRRGGRARHRARAARSRSSSTPRSRRSPPPAATRPTTPATSHPRPAARRATPWSRSAAPSAAAARDGRLRGQEQEALQERRLDRAQRLHGRARRRVRACSSSPARTRCPSGLEELTEYQGNKMIVVARPRRARPARAAARLPLRAARVLVARRRRSRGRRRRRPRRGRGGGGAPQARAIAFASRSPASRTRAEAAREEFDEMVADVERCLARIEGLVAVGRPRPTARAAAARRSSSGAAGRPSARRAGRRSARRR